MRFVSRDERSQLTAARDPKARIRTTIDLAEGHLTQAEDLTSQKRFARASEELGGYLGLIDDAKGFAGGLNRDKGSTRDLYRFMDIALRRHIPRLAVMRRDTPAEYAGNIKAAEEYARDSRTEALDSFYGHSVLREGVNNEKKPLTDEETDLVRYYQELDKRVEVFIKAVNRRFAIINGTAQPSSKKLVKDEPDWGPLPKGTRAELLGDIAGILDEAITNIDDVNRRDEKNPLISRSLRKLTAAANGYLTQLVALKNQTKDADEASAIDKAADSINEIIAVGNKLPPPAPDSDKKKKKP